MRMRNRERTVLPGLILVLGLLVLASGCSTLWKTFKREPRPEPTPEAREPRKLENIRVSLLKQAKRVKVSSFRPVKIYNMQSKKLIGKKRLGEDNLILIRDGRIIFDQQFLPATRLRLVPEKDEYLTVNGKRYRGQIDISVDAEHGGLLVVNYLPLELYLQGVVPREVPAAWPAEALKVQAVAARTFALYKMSGRAKYAYDVDASVNSQVYGGLDSEKKRSNEAVAATRGRVMIYQDKFIAAFYHANCGGATANVRNVWGGEMAYLGGVSCGFCEEGPHYSWEYSMSQEDLTTRLQKRNSRLGRVKRIEPAKRDHSGRLRTVKITHSLGQEDMKAAAFRMLVGPDKIRSTKFYVENQRAAIQFKGQGWGHGVGLCQEGARGMARSGFTYRDILRHYYPGTELRRVY